MIVFGGADCYAKYQETTQMVLFMSYVHRGNQHFIILLIEKKKKWSVVSVILIEEEKKTHFKTTYRLAIHIFLFVSFSKAITY